MEGADNEAHDHLIFDCIMAAISPFVDESLNEEFHKRIIRESFLLTISEARKILMDRRQEMRLDTTIS